MAGPSVLMAATTRLVAPQRRGLANGIVNAGGSFGQFVFAPIAQVITSAHGWVAAVQSLGAITLLALPAAWVLRGRPQAAPAGDGTSGGSAGGSADDRTNASSNAASNASSSTPPAPSTATTAAPSIRQVIATALADRSYRLLAAGFFVCGFHVAFLATHLPGAVASCGLPRRRPPGRWRSSACSTSSAASRWAGPSVAGG